MICFIDIARFSPQVRPHDCSVSDPCIKFEKSMYNPNKSMTGVPLVPTSQVNVKVLNYLILDIKWPWLPPRSSAESCGMNGDMATSQVKGWQFACVFCFFVDLQCPGVVEKCIYLYIYTHNLICHREQSKLSKDLCISAVAVVVSLIISMCFFIFSWSDGLDLEIPPKPIESAQIHWVTKVFDQ